MIIEETFEFEAPAMDNPLKVSEIEEFILKKGITPVRFSLISREKNKIKMSVSGIKKD